MIQTPPPGIPDIPFDWNLFINNTLAPIVVTVIVVSVEKAMALTWK